MKVALLGFPQAGKRTLFTLLTGRSVQHGGGEETKAVEGVARINDPRVDVLGKIARSDEVTYAHNNIVLCPDIVTGSAGRDWLEPAGQCELLCMVVRDFASASVYHFAGSVDAERDRANLRTELLLADLEIVEKRLQKIAKEKRAGLTPAQALEEKTLQKCSETLEKDTPLNKAGLEPHELAAVKNMGFLTLNPVLWIFNVDEDRVGGKGRPLPAGGSDTLAVSCQIEKEIMAIEDPAERNEYLRGIGLESSGLDRLNRAAYDFLGLMSFYTIANNKVRAWTIRKGTCAPAAGGKVHTDIERGFIRVEVIKFDDLTACGGEHAAKEAGKMQLKGKDYVIEDGDVCRFLFNV